MTNVFQIDEIIGIEKNNKTIVDIDYSSNNI